MWINTPDSRMCGFTPHSLPLSHRLKTILHVLGTVSTLPVALALFWRPGAGPATWWHLRVLLLLRMISAVLGESCLDPGLFGVTGKISTHYGMIRGR